MPFAVLLTADAARDLEDLYQYIAVHDAPGKADHVLRELCRTPIFSGSFTNDLPQEVPDEETAPNFSGE